MIISIGKWRWPVTVGLPFIVGGVLALAGLGRLSYEAKSVAAFTGDSRKIDQELKIFQADANFKKMNVTVAKVPGHPLEAAFEAEGPWPSDVLHTLKSAVQSFIDKSFANQKAKLRQDAEALRQKHADLEARLTALVRERKGLRPARPSAAARSDVSAQIRKLLNRRQLLIDRFPNHTDIQLLAKKIQDLQNPPQRRSSAASRKLTDLSRQMNETTIRLDYFSRRLQQALVDERALKPAWKVVLTARAPQWPSRVKGWPLCSGILAGVFMLACLLFKSGSSGRKRELANGLWAPNAVDSPVRLKVVPAETAPLVRSVPEETLPGDPLTQKAAELYSKWVEVAKVLYAPAQEPPQGIIETVGPLLQESSDFLPEGHDVLARYLARTVTAGDLPAHVARTVLMTLTGAQDAGVSPEHCLAMTLAALFHDLAVVPRPAAVQEEVGSDVGRLSASLLRRIPGLQPALLAMVEEILIGMDEFKLEIWQNVAKAGNLEPLSKVIREIDRFEKVMQKQRARLDRQIILKKVV